MFLFYTTLVSRLFKEGGCSVGPLCVWSSGMLFSAYGVWDWLAIQVLLLEGCARGVQSERWAVGQVERGVAWTHRTPMRG